VCSSDLQEQDGEKEGPGNFFFERAKFIPLRLSLEERKLLRLIDGALAVSDYTDKVDILALSPSKRVFAQLTNISAILCGLATALDYENGQKLIDEKDFPQNQEILQKFFEIERRYKITNPGSLSFFICFVSFSFLFPSPCLFQSLPNSVYICLDIGWFLFDCFE